MRREHLSVGRQHEKYEQSASKWSNLHHKANFYFFLVYTLAFQVALAVFRLSLLRVTLGKNKTTCDDIPIHMRRRGHKEFLATIDPIIQTEFWKCKANKLQFFCRNYPSCPSRLMANVNTQSAASLIWECFSRDHFLRVLEIFCLKSPNI